MKTAQKLFKIFYERNNVIDQGTTWHEDSLKHDIFAYVCKGNQVPFSRFVTKEGECGFMMLDSEELRSLRRDQFPTKRFYTFYMCNVYQDLTYSYGELTVDT